MHRTIWPVGLILILLFTGCRTATPPPVSPAGRVLSVRDFGAVGDGTTRDTAAIQKTLDACALQGGGEVVVSAGRYLIGSVQVSSRTTLRLEQDAVLIGSADLNDYPMIDIRWEGRWQSGRRALIHAGDAQHIRIVGPGRVEGNPDVAKGQNPRGVVVIETIRCDDVRLENLTITQGGNWATHPTYCRDVVFKNVTIRGNRDGIDIDSCNNVLVEGCDIDSGDDSISLKSGRGMDGARIGRATENVVISNCMLRCRNFACIGIGSETSGGVRHVRIEHCKMNAKTHAIYIKSKIGRAGTDEDIEVDDVDVTGGGFLRVNLVGAGNKNTTDDPVEGWSGIPEAKSLVFKNIRLHDAREIAAVTQVPAEKPIRGLKLINISGSAGKGIALQHVRDAELSRIDVKIAQGDRLAIHDVTGKGLEAAVTLMNNQDSASTTPSSVSTTQASTQPDPNRPDPREIPLPKIHAPMGPMPGVDELPVRKEMPDPLVMNDGAKVTTRAQWPARRAEILRRLEYYATGQAPPPPGNVKGTVVHSESVIDGPVNFKYELVHLTFGPQEKLSLDIGFFTPLGDGPFPVVIAPAGTPPHAKPLPALDKGPTQGKGTDVLLVVGGGIPATRPSPTTAAPTTAANVPNDWFGGKTAAQIAEKNPALKRGYAYVIFNNNDCGEDTTLRNLDGSWAYRDTRFFPAYPNHDWGLLRCWGWGASRIVDYLETDARFDRNRFIITGASRTGKSAMITAAFDERFAMCAPCVTGGAGIGALRFAGPAGSESLTAMVRKYPNWFSPNLHPFWGQAEKLPYDQHWFLAACAPRAFLALEAKQDTISLPSAVRKTLEGASPVYELLGASQKIGVNYANHGHVFNDEDWSALLDFADIHLGNKTIDRKFDHFIDDPENK